MALATMKEIQVGLGLSVEIKDNRGQGSWYRPNCQVTLELNEPCTQAQRDVIFKKAWEQVTDQINKIIEELVTAQTGQSGGTR